MCSRVGNFGWEGEAVAWGSQCESEPLIDSKLVV